MGGIGFGDIVKTVVGVGGLASSTYSAYGQSRYINNLLNEGNEQRSLVRGIDKYFLGGGKARQLDIPGMQDQFAEIDFATQEQLRNIDSQAAKSRQQIADTLPSGGAKLRALADLAVQSQEARGKAIREAQSAKRDLDTKLTNEYLQAAMGRKTGAGYDAQLYAALQDYGNRQKDISSIGTVLGSMLGEGEGDESSTGLEYSYTSPGDVSGKSVESAATWSPEVGVLGTGNEESADSEYLKPWEKKIKSGLSVGKFTY